MNGEQFENAVQWIQDHGLPAEINAINDVERQDGQPLYLNEDDGFGDAYWYTEDELPGLIEDCGWDGTTPSDILAGGVEVPEDVIRLANLKPTGMRWHRFAAIVADSSSLEDLQSTLQQAQ
jgi:hypothetical protein